MQETNTPNAPALPEDQPYQFEGLENTNGRDAALLVHENFSPHCTSIQNVTPHNDICWRLIAQDENGSATVVASFYAPHVGCPEEERLAFWQRLFDSVGEVMGVLPGVELVMVGHSNLWVPGLVQARGQRPADRGCLASLRVMLQTYGLEICNPLETPTHSRGAALDLVIASPGAVESVHVHSPICPCVNANLCCPLVSSDHYAVEVIVAKRLVPNMQIPEQEPLHVRDWENFIRSQEQRVRQWSRRTQAHLANLVAQSTSHKRSALDNLYDELLGILWHADPSLYRRPRLRKQRQPSWWNDTCFAALLARNAAWRQRNRTETPDASDAFRAARNQFHRVERHAKSVYWASWLRRLENWQLVCPRTAARMVRRRFRGNVCRVAPRLTPEHRDFDVPHFRRVRRRVQRIRAARDADCHVANSDNASFTVFELKAALQHCVLDKAPGSDRIPYGALCIKIPWWQDAILQFLELCRSYGCIPSMWKHGIVVPLAKTPTSTERDGYRPITLTSCFAKTLEKLILNRIKPAVDPQLDTSQAGFRWGSDVQFYSLFETLRLRQGSRTFCALTSAKRLTSLGERVRCVNSTGLGSRPIYGT